MMNSPKIPNLNLFRGKRDSRSNQMAQIQQKGMKLLKMGTHKQLVDDLQAQLYLDNYRSNLKHFVSPTKYKQQAERYIKQNIISDQVYLKALHLPQQTKICTNCFDQYIKTNKQCYCEIQHKVPAVYRYKSSYLSPRQQVLANKANEQDRSKREEPLLQSIKNSGYHKKHQIDSKQFSLTQSQFAQQSQQSHEQSIKQQSKIIKQVFSRGVAPEGSIFLKQIKKRQDYLQNIDMDMRQSRVQVDFQGLTQAKRQYVYKSHQILDRLNQIINNYQS